MEVYYFVCSFAIANLDPRDFCLFLISGSGDIRYQKMAESPVDRGCSYSNMPSISTTERTNFSEIISSENWMSN